MRSAGRALVAMGASYACAAATIASLALGIAIVVTMGVNSGAGVAQATPEARQSALGLLIAAEIMKLVTGVAVATAVHSCGRVFATSALTAAAGFTAAALIFAAGVLGLIAVLTDYGATLGWPVVVVGLLSVPLTGCWAAMLAFGAPLRRPVRILATVLCISGIIALGLPPVAMLFGLLSIAWWFMLAAAVPKPTA